MSGPSTLSGTYSGGCLCGALRYAVADAVPDVAYCHCGICRRSSGAPVLVWASAPAEAFRYTSGAPAVYRSSSFAQREFCPACGTQLAFRRTEPPFTVDFTVGSLDTPDALPPTYHIWRRSRIGWFETRDTLPRHDDSGPDALNDTRVSFR